VQRDALELAADVGQELDAEVAVQDAIHELASQRIAAHDCPASPAETAERPDQIKAL
jgi:hypothetical protein